MGLRVLHALSPICNSLIISAHLMVLDHVLVHQDDAGALHAAVGALARVGRRIILVLLLHVSAEVGRLCEAAPTKRALKRFLPGLYDNVIQQGLPRHEALVAHRAHEQLLSGVKPLVHVKVPLPLEGLSTVVALKVELFRLFFLQVKMT